MTNVNYIKETFEYLNCKNPYFKGYDTILYEELTQRGDNTCFPKVIEAIENINYFSNCGSVFEFYFPIVAHTLYYKPEHANRILIFLIDPIFALGRIDNEDDFIKIINDVKIDYLRRESHRHRLTEEGIKWIENILINQKEEIRKVIEKCFAQLND